MTGSVSGKTNYLIAGFKLEDGREVFTSGKYQKAEKTGVKILTEETFEELVRKLSGQKNFVLGKRS